MGEDNEREKEGGRKEAREGVGKERPNWAS